MNDSEESRSFSVSVSKDGSSEELSRQISPGDSFFPEESKSGDVLSDAISNEQITKDTRILETYTVLSDAISGGMGSVWKVRHEDWDIDLAMKRPQPRFFAEGGRKRKEEFIEECKYWIDLGLHPNVVSCYYVREVGGVPSIFSEWCDGGSLRECIRNGTLYDGTEEVIRERLLDIAIQTARGLSYANSHGLIHQDVKPGNIMLTGKWEAKVTDFGLSVSVADLWEESKRNSTGYTIEYCPQEQADGAMAEKWMDVYAWALTVLAMYLGSRPWKTGAQAYAWIDSDEKRVVIPPQLEQILRRCVGSERSTSSFGSIIEELTSIYESVTGQHYARTVYEVKNTAGTINNRALSFLDLGMEKEARVLLDEALEVDPENPYVTYNRGLLRWRDGSITDEDIYHDMSVIEDRAKTTDIAIMMAQLAIEGGQRTLALEKLDEAGKIIREGSDGKEESDMSRQTELDAISRVREVAMCESSDDVFSCNGVILDVKETVSLDASRAASIIERKEEGTCDQKVFSCVVTDLRSGTVLFDGDKGLCDGNGRLAFLDNGRLIAIHGVRYIEELNGTNNQGYDLDSDYSYKPVSDEHTRVYEIGSGKKMYSFGTKSEYYDIAFGNHYVAAVPLRATDLVMAPVRKGFPVVLLDARNGELIRVLSSVGAPIGGCSFSEDEKRLYVLTQDGVMEVYSVPDGKTILKKSVTGSGVGSARILLAADGSFLVKEPRQDKVRVWNLAGRCLQTRKADMHGVWDFPGKYRAPFSLAHVRSIKEQRTTDQQYEDLMHEARAAYEKSDFAGASGCCLEARELPGYENDPAAINYAEYVGRRGIRTSIKKLQKIDTFKVGMTNKQVSFSWDGNLILCLKDRGLSVLDARDGSVQFRFAPEGETVLAFDSVPMSLLVLVITDARAYLLDRQHGNVDRTLPEELTGRPGRETFVAVSADGRYLAVNTCFVRKKTLLKKAVDERRLCVYDVSSDKIVKSICVSDHCGELRFSKDASRIFVAGRDSFGEIAWMKEENQSVVYSRLGMEKASKTYQIARLDLSDDDRFAIVKCGEEFNIWDIEKRRECMYLVQVYPGGVVDMRFLSRTHLILCTFNDQSIRVMEFDEDHEKDAFPDRKYPYRIDEKEVDVRLGRLTVNRFGDSVAVDAGNGDLFLYRLEWNYRFSC